MVGILTLITLAVAAIVAIYQLKKEKKQKFIQSGYEANYKVEFYRACLKEGIDSVDNAVNQRRAMQVAAEMIAKGNQRLDLYFGLHGKVITPKNTAALYNEGMREDENAQKEEQHYSRLRETEKLHTSAMLFGTDKYLTIARRDLSLYSAEASLRKPIVGKDKNVKAEALKGAMLFGEAYGVASALEAQKYNENNAIQREKAAKYTAPVTADSTSMLRHGLHYHLNKFELTEKIQQVCKLWLDDSDPQRWFEALCIENVTCRQRNDYSISVSGKIRVTQNFNILEKNALLDGSLCIRITDEKGNFVGNTYYCAPGEGDLYMTKVGFEEGEFTSVFHSTKKLTPGKRYTATVAPCKLWLIEK